jgi:hypothetical protein
MAMVTEMRIPAGDHKERFDYRGLHRYLITFTAARKGAPINVKETVLLILEALRGACQEHKFDVFAYAFLPDRLVLIVRGKAEDSDMRGLVGSFRKRVEGGEGGLPPLARRYTERVLRKTESSRDVASGIFAMAVSAGLVRTPAEYPFQGSFVLPDPFPRKRPASPPRHRRAEGRGKRDFRPGTRRKR